MKCSSMPIRHSVALLLSAVVGLAAGGVDLRLVEAAKQRDWETVRGLIAHGSDVNVRQPDGAIANGSTISVDEVGRSLGLLT